MNKLYALAIGIFTFSAIQAQELESLPGPIIVCPAGEGHEHHHTPAAQWIQQLMTTQSLGGGGESCANFEVTYNGFTPEAQAAFQAAVDIWENALNSPVTIKINANWTVLGEGVLGSAGPETVFRNFTNAPDGRFYASALADHIAGEDLDPGFPDINASFNSDFDWYLGTDGNTPFEQYDLVSVVLHEIGHGLGFTSSKNYDDDTGVGSLGLGPQSIPLKYDDFLTLGIVGTNLVDISEGTGLGDAFTGNNVFCDSPEATTANSGVSPKMYAPAEYAGGSTLSHWDEATFPAGNAQSLMTPQIGNGEAIHNPGSMMLGLFEDMGWTLCEGGGSDDDCETWVDPSPTTGWNDFNTEFGGAPCDDGSGCPFNEIDAFEVFASEAYAVNGFIAGGTYTFSMCNGPGAGSWVPEFTIIAPSGAIDASGAGDGDGCSITWTASEDGTYFIVINEAGNCGVANAIGNGYPALTCDDGTAECEPSEPCSVEPLALDGPDTICPEETTTVEVSNPAEIPTGGGLAIEFLNVDDNSIINLTGVELPYTFDNDLNGLLSANDFDPFIGEYELTAFVYTDVDDLAGSTCATASSAVTVFFLDENDPACADPEPCSVESLSLDGPDTLCPEETTTVETSTPAEIPTGGGLAIEFLNVDDNSIINLTGVELPYTFDNDLNGLLSANDFDPFVGEYELTAFVYTDVDDLAGSTCAIASSAVTVFFLDENDPACADPEPCSVESLALDGPDSICPEETTTVEVSNPAEIPTGGGLAIEFLNVDDNSIINLTGVELPYTFDNDLNGLLSANDFDPFIGEYELTAFVYTDVDDLAGSTCATASSAVTVFFLDENDPACADPEPCSVESLALNGPDSICPEETTTVDVSTSPEIPTGGGLAIEFLNVDDNSIINLTGVELPYTFDNDLNGLLSANDFDPFLGEYELTAFVYTDVDDLAGSTCATAASPETVYFLDENDPACVSGIEDLSRNVDWDVFPNPAHDQVQILIQTSFNSLLEIKIYDMSGRLASSSQYAYNGSSPYSIDISELNQGLYQIIIQTDDFSATKTLVVVE